MNKIVNKLVNKLKKGVRGARGGGARGIEKPRDQQHGGGEVASRKG